jgi:hypothetical protein
MEPRAKSHEPGQKFPAFRRLTTNTKGTDFADFIIFSKLYLR